MIRKIFLLSVVVISMSACYYDNFRELNPFLEEAACDTAAISISFATQVQPILQNQCSTGSAGCHSSASNRDLSTYNGVVNTYTASKLISSIIWDGNASQMPKNAGVQIDNCSIVTIQKWVSQGKLNN
jgi:hypothetical protein